MTNIEANELLNPEFFNPIVNSITDKNILSPFDVDCCFPNSSFFISKIDHDRTIFQLQNVSCKLDGNSLFLVARYISEDITNYQYYLEKEYEVYQNMEGQINDLLYQIGFGPLISLKGFIFLFLYSIATTLKMILDDVMHQSLEVKLSYIVNLTSLI